MAFSAFFAGLSGLRSHSEKLSVIGNNLANVNTVGYKNSRMFFHEVFSQASGGVGISASGNPSQIGLGVTQAGVDNVFAQGSLQTTDVVTDVAIQGNGFFVARAQDGTRFFTRDGHFSFSKDGELITSSGLNVQGYTALDANGNVVTSGTLQDVIIPQGVTAPPEPTAEFTARINLDVSARVDDPATALLDEAETFTTTFTVFDSLGARHTMTLDFRPVDTDADGALEQWDYTVTLPGAEVAGGVAGTPFVVDAGTIQFDANGQLVAPGGNLTLNVPGWANGAAAQTMTWNLYESSGAGNLTGYEAPSATSSIAQDGFAVGELRALTIDAEGLISGIFTNGEVLQLARISLALFNNPNGLLKSGLNNFLATQASGDATIGSANAGGRGGLTPNALELSNVDMTREFTDMLITQRGYQANSRIINVTDQVVQEALTLVR